MQYIKAELLSSDIYLVDIRFMKNAHAAASGMWADMIRKCIRSTDADYIINDMVEVPKSLVLDALKDESVCELWKAKIKEVFKIEESKIEESYHNFGFHGYKLDVFRKNDQPLFVGNTMTPDEAHQCLLSDMSDWDHKITFVEIGNKLYLKLKFKKK